MRLLIVGSLQGQLGTATKMAMQRGAKVSQVGSVEAALGALRSGQGAELIMVDIQYDVTGLIDGLTAEHINVPVVACGVGADSEAAVRAIEGGAKEFIPLPPDPELIAAVLEAVTEESHKLIFHDPSMAEIIALADQIAPSEASILIAGESGTGKEVLARRLHAKSRRANRSFVSVNCAAIPENLLESELFGHEKGAFTGAVARRIGKFEEADGGTLLLDEVSEMDIRLQAKLLRAIQEREIDRVGGSKPVKVDIRLVATTNRNLTEEVDKGTFREDLLFRLNVFTLRLPPLRDRPADIAPLCDYFIEKYATVNAVPRRALGEDALRTLKAHDWRGNVRELENTMHRAVLLAQGDQIDASAVILSDGSRLHAGQPAPAGALAAHDADTRGLVGRTVADVERDLILETLDHCLGNRTHAANILGISIRTLRNKLKAYSQEGIPVRLPGEASSATI